MKTVEIYELQNNGSQRTIVLCRLRDGEVVCEGDSAFVDNLTQEGIFDYLQKSGQKLYPKDGLKFLECLKFAFKSGYITASEVKEV